MIGVLGTLGAARHQSKREREVRREERRETALDEKRAIYGRVLNADFAIQATAFEPHGKQSLRSPELVREFWEAAAVAELAGSQEVQSALAAYGQAVLRSLPSDVDPQVMAVSVQATLHEVPAARQAAISAMRADLSLTPLSEERWRWWYRQSK